jgi:alpha-galactosidase
VLLTDCQIAINQDWLGVQGHRVASTKGSGGGSLDVYAGPLGGGDIALVLFNRDATAQSITANFSDIGLSVGSTARVRNVWRRNAHGEAMGSLSVVVNSHGAEFFRLTPLHSTTVAVASA